MQSFQGSCKAALAIARRRVPGSPKQIRVAEVHLDRLARLFCRIPLPYHSTCSKCRNMLHLFCKKMFDVQGSKWLQYTGESCDFFTFWQHERLCKTLCGKRLDSFHVLCRWRKDCLLVPPSAFRAATRSIPPMMTSVMI